ncbi:winged helix-turn-helix domain-containing protein [Amorphus orientalis]|uniref:Molybdate transport system regulatory protein n=1 Tax=Amorphus orientalis TaxID=649198 RepID=A0AAE4AT12_9HYPH|nr:LysR family transcriptional regulator [Amorphus orientalis]MDQ0315853.1 molybdate transport system regulatory protein [Amorphus orientalis]
MAAEDDGGPALRIRIDFPDRPSLGPGKIALLEAIESAGSITSAARAMKMSYRRAWLLVEELNSMFAEPLVTTQLGGARGGGAMVTPAGRGVIESYRAVEARAAEATEDLLGALSDPDPAADDGLQGEAGR